MLKQAVKRFLELTPYDITRRDWDASGEYDAIEENSLEANNRATNSRSKSRKYLDAERLRQYEKVVDLIRENLPDLPLDFGDFGCGPALCSSS